MAKFKGLFLLFCLLNLIHFSTPLWETNSCKTIVRFYLPICQCFPINGIKMVCRGTLAYSEFSGIMQSLRERHNSIKIELKNGGENTRLLTSLQIVHGSLDKIYEHDVSQVGFVKTLNFSYNSLDELQIGSLKSLTETLLLLDLSHNNITVVEDYFKENSTLAELNLSHNKVHRIDTNAFIYLPSLHTLDLSVNELTRLDKYLFEKNSNLQNLNISYNGLTDLNPKSFQGLINLVLLDLASNKLHNLDLNLFAGLIQLVGIDLTKNQLSTLSEDIFLNNTKIKKILILGNQWVCDKELEWISLRVTAKELEITSEASSWKFDNSTLFCGGGPADMKDKNLFKWLRLFAMEKSFNNCPTCKFCDCSIDRDRIGTVVDCSKRNLTQLPKELPYITTKINLTDNNIRTIEIHPDFLSTWEEVRILYLDGNEIESLQSLEGHWKLKGIFKLSLTRNRLREVPTHLLDQFVPQLSEFYLSSNPWMCNCNTVRFKTWLIRYHEQIKDLEKMRCSHGDEYNIQRPIMALENRELCPQSQNGLNYLDVLNVLMAFLIVFILAKLTYDYWYRKKTGKFPRFFKIRQK